MGDTKQGVGKGGRGCPDLGENLRGGGPGGPDVWIRYMGDETTHWEGVGQIPTQGGLQDHGTETLEGEGR